MADAGALAVAAALPLAWALDLAFGEPRNAWHPVAWLGRVFAPIGAWLRDAPAAVAFGGGAVVWLLGAIALGTAAWALQSAASRAPWWLGVPLLALACKPTFAWRMLRDEVAGVEAALAADLSLARERLARLVSRDVSELDAPAVRGAAIQTLAENLADSVVSPLFWYALFGLPGAVVYRFANTLDAMWGYRGAWEWAGKWAARADDGLSWAPARLAALLLHRHGGWRALRDQARQTPSPNSGWPMAAMALRLGVRLEKRGVYVLNPAGSLAAPAHLQQALRHANTAAWLWVVIATLACVVRAVSS
jgi:adenosylcobinamide-phosphate synthase